MAKRLLDVGRRRLNNQDIKQTISNESQGQIEEISTKYSPINAEGMLYLSKGKWHSLIKLSIDNDQIPWSKKFGSKACKYLSRTQLPSIKTIQIYSADIQRQGVMHLSKAPWKTLELINFGDNRMGAGSLRIVALANWANLKKLGFNVKVSVFEDLNDILISKRTQLKIVYPIHNGFYLLNNKVKLLFWNRFYQIVRFF